VERCGKVWRPKHGPSGRHEAQDGAYLDAGCGCVIVLRACSACAGDYEDPDRSAWAADDAEGEERDGVSGGATEEFPAEE
jgi:hypothetical protein